MALPTTESDNAAIAKAAIMGAEPDAEHDQRLHGRLVAGGLALTRGRGVDLIVAQTERLYRSLLPRPAAPIVEDDPVGSVLTGEGRRA